MPIVLDQANVYYEINIDVKNSTYNLKTYSIADAVDPIPHTYGSISLDTWGDGGSWLQEFYFGYMTSSPTEVLRFTAKIRPILTCSIWIPPIPWRQVLK